MDKLTRENWERIKKHLEETGHTDNWYYKRACAYYRLDRSNIQRGTFT